MRHKFRKLETEDPRGMVWVDEVCLLCGVGYYLVRDLEICPGGNTPESLGNTDLFDVLGAK